MNIDVSLSYKALLIEVENKIKEIAKIGFDVSEFNKELENIKLDNSNKIKENKKESFDGFLYLDYTNAINNLNKLQAKLDVYNIYIKIYYYTKYLEKLDINKSNIKDIITEIKILLKGLRNSSIMDYEDEKHLVEPFYKMIFKVIYNEIYFYQTSELLEFCKLDSVDSTFIANMIEKYLEEVNISNYNDIELNYYNIKKSGILNDLLDIEFIKSIVFRDEKGKIEENLKVRYGEVISKICVGDNNIENILQKKDSIEKNIEMYQRACNRNIKRLIKSFVSFAISFSIPVGIFFGLFNLFKIGSSIYSYQTTTSTYSTLNDDIEISNQREIIESNDLQEKMVYLIKYEVLSDKEAHKESKSYNKYSEYDDLEAKYKLRNTLKYDLSFLGYDDINKYVEYVKSDKELPKPTKDTIDISLKNENYTNLVDYYEIVYKLVNLETKEYEGYDKFFSIGGAVALTLLASLVPLTMGVLSYSPFLNNIKYYLEDKKELKYNRKILIETTRTLLDEIGKNDALRKEFNIEMSKYKNLFIEAGLVLPEEVISEEEKAKILSKRNIKK